LDFIFNVLYSNKQLLSKYSKLIPKTWDELIDTCQYIMEKEKNNPKLICYNMLFDESEQGLYSLYDFIYSCRDSFNSTYPKPQDQSFNYSLKMLKKLTEKTASDDIFKLNHYPLIYELEKENYVFLNYWLLGEPFLNNIPYNISILPGRKNGISGSMIIGYSIGITKDIEESKKDAALEVIKYFTSKDLLRYLLHNDFLSLSAINELWYDDKLRKNGLDDTFKDIQFIAEPKFLKEGGEEYKKKFQKYLYQYLYGDKSIEETVKSIDDITKIYYVSLDTKNSYVGLVCFVFYFVTSTLMLLSLIFIYKDKLRPFFKFLSNDFWIITVFGSFILLWIPVISYGRITILKCHLRLLLISIGYTFSICPSLYKLIVQLPKENKISIWIKNHNKYSFLFFIILIEIFMNSIFLINPYTITSIVIEEGENFERCKSNGEYGIIILLVYKFLVIALTLYLTYVERSIPATLNDMRFINLSSLP